MLRIGIVSACALAVICAAARADYSVSGSIVGSTDLADGSPTAHSIYSSAQTFDQTDGAPKTVSFSNSAVNGAIHVSSSVSASLGSFHGIASASDPAGLSGSSAHARAIASATDNLLVTWGSMPVGTPVSILFAIHMDGSVFGDPTTAELVATLHVFDQTPFNSLDLRYDYSDLGSVDFNSQGIFNTQVGQKLSLSYSFSVGGHVSSTSASQTAGGDFGNTAHFYATPGNSGVSLVADSGFNYVAPVPEPASVSCGLMGVVAMLIRRGSRRR